MAPSPSTSSSTTTRPTGCVLALSREVRHEAAHLDRVEPARVVPVDRDGRAHERLRGDELDAEARRHAEARELVRGRERRRGRHLDARRGSARARGRAGAHQAPSPSTSGQRCPRGDTLHRDGAGSMARWSRPRPSSTSAAARAVRPVAPARDPRERALALARGRRYWPRSSSRACSPCSGSARSPGLRDIAQPWFLERAGGPERRERAADRLRARRARLVAAQRRWCSSSGSRPQLGRGGLRILPRAARRLSARRCSRLVGGLVRRADRAARDVRPEPARVLRRSHAARRAPGCCG